MRVPRASCDAQPPSLTCFADTLQLRALCLLLAGGRQGNNMSATDESEMLICILFKTAIHLGHLVGRCGW